MQNNWEENVEIRMTGKNGTPREPLKDDSREYFSKPEIEPVKPVTETVISRTSVVANRNDGGKRRKGMLVAGAVLAVMVLAILLWPCSHEWVDATCTEAKICSKCEKTEGEALGHTWKKATCTQSSVCSRCNETKGTALGHKWNQVTETNYVETKVITYSQCTVCKKKEDQTTSRLTTLLSDNGRTFRITPLEYTERLGEYCRTLGLDVTCSWQDNVYGNAGPGIEIRDDKGLIAIIWVFKGKNLEDIDASDKNKESVFVKISMLMSIGYSKKDALLTAFVAACEPVCETDPNMAYSIVMTAFNYMGEGCLHDQGSLAYEMNITDDYLIMDAFVP